MMPDCTLHKPKALYQRTRINEKVVLVRVGTRCPTCLEVRWEK